MHNALNTVSNVRGNDWDGRAIFIQLYKKNNYVYTFTRAKFCLGGGTIKCTTKILL